ncbi:hypothetical protein IL306_004356, partial [Fusarium sp. DS 682]
MLLNKGKVEVDSRDKNGRSPLSWAAWNRNEAVAKLLLDTGKVNVDSRDKNGRSPLSWAAEDGNEAVAKLLLDTGKVDIDSRDKNGTSPLLWAAEKGRNGKYGGIPPPFRPPLAAWNGHEVVVKLLLDTGKVDIDLTDKNGRSPLSWAAGSGHEAI